MRSAGAVPRFSLPTLVCTALSTGGAHGVSHRTFSHSTSVVALAYRFVFVPARKQKTTSARPLAGTLDRR
jgi:hypothetical protein